MEKGFYRCDYVKAFEMKRSLGLLVGRKYYHTKYVYEREADGELKYTQRRK